MQATHPAACRVAATLGALAVPGPALTGAPARYDELRRPRAQLIARRSRQVGHLGQLQGRSSTTARDVLMRAAPTRLADRQLDVTVGGRPPRA